MALINRQELIVALTRLGQLAEEKGGRVELALVGGALMVLLYETRDSTRDVDVIILAPGEAAIVRGLACVVADELGWPGDWLNDGAKGYLIGLSPGPTVFAAPGIEVWRPSTAQLLAMKLSAWRDDVDIADASCLLRELPGSRDDIWQTVERYLTPGNELKAQYAFADLWETIHGDN